MTVITISRQLGSGGDEIATRLCEMLGFRMFDRRLIAQAAAESGISEEEIMDYSEENHKLRGFLDRLLSREPNATHARIWKEDTTGARVIEDIRLEEEVLITLVQRAIRAAHRQGRMVIVGRGGQAVLRDEDDVLHVRIEAPMEERLQRLKEEIRLTRQAFYADIELRREAQDRIIQRDAASADYLRRFYSVDWSDPLLYHIVLNTGKLSLEECARTIALIAEAMSSSHTLEPGLHQEA